MALNFVIPVMEQKLLFLINREWTSPALDRGMALMSSFAFWAVPLLVTVVLVLIFGGFKARAMVLMLGVVIGISDGLVSDSLKKIVQRPRPHEVLADVRRVDLGRAQPRWLGLFKPVKVELSRPQPGKIGGRSFPSSHTMDNFCAAAVMTFFYRRLGQAWFVVASVVAYSRIYVGSHWPSDVAISIVLALGVSLLLVPLCEWLWRKIGARFLPNLFVKHPTLIGAAAV